MSEETINIVLNERPMTVPKGMTLYKLRTRQKRDADVLIRNGAPMKGDAELAEGDQVVLIRRGEMPGREELEALMTARHTPGVHEKVKKATVGIAGLGGLGSAVAIALARIGIGKMVLADFDVVEPSNLNRQQYFVYHIGTAKTDAMKEILGRINPFVKLETHNVVLTKENVTEVFKDVDVMVEAFDKPDCKVMLVQAFAARMPKTPVVMVSGLAGHASNNSIKTRRLTKNLYVIGDLVSAAQEGRGLMAPRVGIAASHEANAVLALLLGEDPSAD